MSTTTAESGRPTPGSKMAARVIRTVEEYRAAMREMEKLQRSPLGTPETEGLQDLVEAILDYESRHASNGAALH